MSLPQQGFEILLFLRIILRRSSVLSPQLFRAPVVSMALLSFWSLSKILSSLSDGGSGNSFLKPPLSQSQHSLCNWDFRNEGKKNVLM